MKLNRLEFADALRKGLGRAFLYVQRHGLDDVADLVMEACGQDQSYDPQCEPGRASWLFKMIHHSPHYAKIRQSIFSKLESETSTWDLLQILQLVKEMAVLGDAEARNQLRNRVLEIAHHFASDDWLGSEEWVELEGVKGVLELARIYGARLMRDPDDRVPLLIFEDYNEYGNKLEYFLSEMQVRAEKEPEILVYLDYLRSKNLSDPIQKQDPSLDKDKESHLKSRNQITLQIVLQRARDLSQSIPIGRFIQFGRQASSVELEEIYRILLLENNNLIKARFLKVFHDAPLPRLDDVFFEWIQDEDDDLRFAAIGAMAHTKDPRIRALAIGHLEAGKFLEEEGDRMMRWFLGTFKPGDALRIAEVVKHTTPSPDTSHYLGRAILELSEAHLNREFAELLHWVYENTPCSNCRLQALKDLNRIDSLDSKVGFECHYDSSEDIQLFARNLGAVSEETAST